MRNVLLGLALLSTTALIGGCSDIWNTDPSDPRHEETTYRNGWGSSWVSIVEPADGDEVENPVLFRIEAANVAQVQMDADGWPLSDPWDPAHYGEFSYVFSGTGYERVVTLVGLDEYGDVVASDTIRITPLWYTPPPATDEYEDEECALVDSANEDYAPVQVAAAGLPYGAAQISWVRPAAHTYHVPFAGTPGYSASHEGVDFVLDDSGTGDVWVHAAADGVVAYVREGCPETGLFSPNQSQRECGAGWGNHVVINHGDGIFARYAHLRPGYIGVFVGMEVRRGDPMAVMGNSGRSEVRHLHFELGTSDGFDSCAMSQSLDAVHDPDLLDW